MIPSCIVNVSRWHLYSRPELKAVLSLIPFGVDRGALSVENTALDIAAHSDKIGTMEVTLVQHFPAGGSSWLEVC